METWTFAAVGDVHGHTSTMVDLVRTHADQLGVTIDFVLQVGDFEPHRDTDDLRTMAAPSKYRALGDFPSYYKGERVFPWPVYFIGGNHEPYGLLDQEPSGFALLPWCTYLGRSYSGQVCGLQVCALSGIYGPDYFTKRRPPVDAIKRVSNKEYIYFREPEVEQLFEQEGADVLLLHEWPTGVIADEDQTEFEKQRRSLRHDAVGNEYAGLLLEKLKPQLVLCGHMHRPYHRRLTWPDGTDTLFVALAHIQMGADAIAFFSVRTDGTIHELDSGDI